MKPLAQFLRAIFKFLGIIMLILIIAKIIQLFFFNPHDLWQPACNWVLLPFKTLKH